MLLFLLFCILLRSILDQIDSSYGTPILEQSIRDYKIVLGCSTIGGVVLFLVFLIFGMDSQSLPWFFYFCSAIFPSTALSVVVKRMLNPSDLFRTPFHRVVSNTNIASIASVIFTFSFICLKELNDWPNEFAILFQHVNWVLHNFPYYIEFWQLMTEHLSLRIVWGDDDVAKSNSSDESDDEQIPNLPTNILISSEDLECTVCFLPFSDRRVPLVLTKCGHSLCKKCCKAAQQQVLFSRFIKCPFCRTRTPGSIEKLPKNYTVMGIVQKIGQIDRDR